MTWRIRAAWAAVGRTFGIWVAPAFSLLLFLALRLLVALCSVMDGLLFRSFREARVVAPIVLVGPPRTGTTFLHRFLHQNRVGVARELWQMLYPSLLLQRLVRPLLPLLEVISPARHHSTEAHQTGLTSVETDDASLLFRFFDGFFLYAFFVSFLETDFKERFDPRTRDVTPRDARFLRRVWRNSLASSDCDRVVAKLFSLGLRLPHFLSEFPDARIIYTVRDPVQAVPSTLSLVTGVLELRFGFWDLPEEIRRRHLDRLYAGVLELHQRFHADWQEGAIDRSRVLVVPFDELMMDFEGSMSRILDHAGLEAGEELLETIGATATEQRSYVSSHRYDLDRFGLDEERIRRDFDFVYETFLAGDSGTAPTL